MEKKVYIWGTGKYYNWIRRWLKNVIIVGFVSSDTISNFEGVSVFKSIDDAMIQNADYLIIASIYTDEIVRKLLNSKFTLWEKILVLEPTPMTKMMELRDSDNTVLDENFYNQFSSLYGSINVGERIMPQPNYNPRKMVSLDIDPVRKYTLSMICDEIELNNIQGDTAEFGVFTGEFAKEINAVFHDRKLFLFDTFEGFPERDIESASQFSTNVVSFTEACKNTNIELVMSKMEHPEQVVVYKGLFPESTESIDYAQRFSFVSIDVDFKDNTLAGLKFFYPRMSKGGYMMVHDYNNKNENGDFGMMVKEAISEYQSEMNEVLVRFPICDRGGTVVIQKI